MGVRQLLKRTLETFEDQKYNRELESARGSYAQWLSQQNPPACSDVADYFSRHPETLILYGDEDVREGDGEPKTPWFRPDWSPELLETSFYVGSFLAIRRSFLEESLPDWRGELGRYEKKPEREQESAAVIFVNESPDPRYLFLMRTLFQKAGGWDQNCRSVAHLPQILHHCGSEDALKKFARDEAQPLPETGESEKRLLSVIIPSKDHPELLLHCLASLRAAAGELPVEIIVVDNGSSRENRAKLENLEGVSYLYRPMEFDFARMCNLGAAAAEGEFLLFLNDDVELLPQSGLGRMEELAGRAGIGCVGLKLYYPDSVKIQHAGITNLFAGPVHKLQFLEDDREYYFGMNRGLRNVLAVSGACLMVGVDKFRRAGGFEETLKIAYNDVALGFRLYEMGYRNVCVCDAYAYHHESLTRGSDESGENRERLLEERARLYELFPDRKGGDPYYSDFLENRRLDTRVRPAYETMHNKCRVERPVRIAPDQYREDACLMLSVEDERNGELSGYALVLGDDNACYERQILLRAQDGEIFAMEAKGQYRPDLEENLPDQKNVALGGFWLKPMEGTLKEGTYRIGCTAKNRVGSTKLMVWSDRYCVIGSAEIGEK